MKPIPKFDVASYVLSHPGQDPAEISKLAGLASDQLENQNCQISRLADLANHKDEITKLTDQEIINLLNQATYNNTFAKR